MQNLAWIRSTISKWSERPYRIQAFEWDPKARSSNPDRLQIRDDIAIGKNLSKKIRFNRSWGSSTLASGRPEGIGAIRVRIWTKLIGLNWCNEVLPYQHSSAQKAYRYKLGYSDWINAKLRHSEELSGFYNRFIKGGQQYQLKSIESSKHQVLFNKITKSSFCIIVLFLLISRQT